MVKCLGFNAWYIYHGKTLEKFLRKISGKHNDWWNISYAIKIWLNVVLDNFIMVLTLGWWTMQHRCELDYSSVGFDFVGSGGQGGTLISPRKPWERCLKWLTWSINDSFGLLLGLYEWFSSSREICYAMQQPSLSPGRYALDVVCNTVMVCFLSLRFGILLMVSVWFGLQVARVARRSLMGL